MPYLILKEYRMPNDYPILHDVFPGEDQNVMSISPSQIGRTYSNKGMYLFLPKRNVPKLPLRSGIYKFLLSKKLLFRLPVN